MGQSFVKVGEDKNIFVYRMFFELVYVYIQDIVYEIRIMSMLNI